MKHRIIQGLLALILICCLVLPAGLAYAEEPLSLGIVASSAAAEGLGSPFQHHSFTADGVHWVFYQATGLNLILCSWSVDGTTWVAHAPIRYCNGSTAETIGGQFDTWYYPADDTVHFVVVNTSTNNSNILFAKYAINATAHTLTIDGSWVTAVAGVANVAYRNPTICVQNDQDFITYGAVFNGVSNVSVTSTANCAGNPWVADTGFPMTNLSANASFPSIYGSVIPLYTNDNVSVQYAGYNGSVYKIYQTNIGWSGATWEKGVVTTVDTSNWRLPVGAEWNYNAVSIDTAINDNDVAIQCVQTNGSAYRIFFNRRGNESDLWASTYARNFGEGGWTRYYVGAMGIRNAIYALVYSGWDMVALSTNIYSNDYDATTGSWAGILGVDTDIRIPYVSTMSEYTYDPAGTGYIGFLYGTDTNDNLMYGLYGPPLIPTTVNSFINATGMIVSLLISLLLIILILGIALREGMNNGWNEATKIAIAGIMGIVIIETIIIAFF